MKPVAISIIYITLFAWIVAILPTACDTEYDREHPVYISDADQYLIDNFKGKNNE